MKINGAFPTLSSYHKKNNLEREIKVQTTKLATGEMQINCLRMTKKDDKPNWNKQAFKEESRRNKNKKNFVIGLRTSS